MIKIFFFSAFISLCIVQTAFAQTELDERAYVSFKKGLGFLAADSSVGINLKFRMQNLFGVSTVSGQDLNISQVEARVKRLRLRFDGFIKNKNIAYYMQLSFSRNDIDWDNTQIPNIIRDAMIYYHFNENFYIGFGQSKLPGNRQRVISSGSQQFVDRSFVNANFTLDRDFGIFAYYSNKLGSLNYNLKGAVSDGEGRTGIYSDDGLCYTGRIELLPLGAFTKNGDYFEGDLAREKSPKISLAGGYSINQSATKSLGQRGIELYQKRNLENLLFDALFKYSGWALSSEYLSRYTQNPFTVNTNNDTAMVYTGYGVNTQLSYLFKNNFELAFRYAFLRPSQKIKYETPVNDIYTFGITKYVKEHLLKLQTNVSYNSLNTYFPNTPIPKQDDKWMLQFQIELGI
ncbi:MAG: porin [Bacteroidales bacterium]|nr:porin [Bacteroidales bacterium]